MVEVQIKQTLAKNRERKIQKKKLRRTPCLAGPSVNVRHQFMYCP